MVHENVGRVRAIRRCLRRASFLLLLLTPRRYVRRWAVAWTDFTLWWLRLTVGLTHRICGLEHLPAGPAIIAIKHQSSWETVAVVRLLPDAAIVMKRELLFIPIVGMAMADGRATSPSSAGMAPRALRSLVRGGQECRWPTTDRS